MAYGENVYGLRDVKITNIAGTTQVDLPSAMELRFSERVKSGELAGDDATVAVAARSDAAEWSLSNGGISLEAYALLTGRTVATSGTTPNETTTLTGEKTEGFPYVKIYGQVIDDSEASDIHCLIYKAKITSGLEGTFQDGDFWVSQCSGVAIDDGTNGTFDFVRNETKTAVPAS